MQTIEQVSQLSDMAKSAKAFIEDQIKNKVFVINFTKADGSVRRLRGQYGVHVGIKGTGHKNPEHLIKIYDHDEKNPVKKFKSVNLEQIISIDCGALHWDNRNY